MSTTDPPTDTNGQFHFAEHQEMHKELGGLDPRLQPAYRHRSGTFEKKPEMMLGTINFLFICHVIYAVQKLVGNYYDQGTLIDMSLAHWLLRHTGHAFLILILLVVWCISVFYWITKLLVKKQIPHWVGVGLYIFSQAVLYAVPLTLVFYWDFAPFLSGVTCMQIAVWSMKMHSYWWTNQIMERNYRLALASKSKESPKAKDGGHPMYWTHFLYFLCAPTLIYEISYPKVKSINWLYFTGLLLQAWSCFFVIYLIIVDDLLPIYSQSHYIPIIRSCLMLALPSFSVWMLLFYCLFHCILGMIAELTFFADREFFQDWWNARSFDGWWRRWNRPVHKWMLRHIYLDSMQTVNYNKDAAAMATFAISALAHEFILAVSFKMIRPILFTTMILQLGMTYMTKLPFVEGTELGNFIMWICLLVGQPAVQILYAREYFISTHEAAL